MVPPSLPYILLAAGLLYIFGSVLYLLCGWAQEAGAAIAQLRKRKISEQEKKEEAIRRRHVLETSELLPAILELNKDTRFDSIQPILSFSRRLNSKAQFDDFDPRECALEVVEDNLDWFSSWHSAAQSNSVLWHDYSCQLAWLPLTPYGDDALRKTELSLAKEYMLEPPVQHVSMRISWMYKSPQGRNCYSGQKIFNSDQIGKLIKTADLILQKRTSRQYQIKKERAAMTSSLRYDIMKRDGFRCQLCGSTVSDGVKLHVDHIVPVSKGGKTKPSNLRTLCDRCNFGKRDKIEGDLQR